MSLKATGNVISSPESADGLSHSNSQEWLQTVLFGQEAAHVSRSQSSESSKDLPTSATSGLSSIASSKSAALQRCLANRLRQRLGVNGSMEYELTWKESAMRSGPAICVLRASVRRTSGKDFSGWVTPTTRDWKDTPGMSTLQGDRVRLDQLPRQAAQYLGTSVCQSLIGLETPVAVNPDLARWLQGFPTTWSV